VSGHFLIFATGLEVYVDAVGDQRFKAAIRATAVVDEDRAQWRYSLCRAKMVSHVENEYWRTR
jgi:hypothetical protein